MIANSDTYVVYIQVSSRSTTNLAPSQIRYDWRSSQWKVERNESWKSKKAKTRKTKVTICVPINVFELNASCFSMSIKFGIQARTVHNTGWMVNVTVNDSTRATLDTHTNTQTQRRSQTTLRADDACNFVAADQLNWNWKPNLRLSSTRDRTADYSPSRERERERSTAGKRAAERLPAAVSAYF